MKKLKTIILFVLMTTTSIFTQSCRDNSTDSNNNNPNLVTSINGTVNNLPPAARNLKVIMSKDTNIFVVASQTIGSNNNMNINLATPPSTLLLNIFDVIIPGSGINFSDPSAKGNTFQCNLYDSLGIFNGILLKTNYSVNNLQQGDILINYIYCDRTENITGSSTNIVNNDTVKTVFNLQLGAGYNKCTYYLKVVRDHYKEYEFNSGETSGANWNYFGSMKNEE